MELPSGSDSPEFSVRAPRRPRRTRPPIRVGLAALAAGVMLVSVTACGASSDDPGAAAIAAPEPTTTVAADHPVALLAEPDGSMLYAERLTGSVRRLRPDGTVDPDVVARVDVAGSEADQRGLLGLARGLGGALFAAWVRADDSRLVVGRIDGPAPVIIWAGPPSADLANGGHLTTAPDGRLVIGIGDLLQDRDLADDPSVPNRKILTLDPKGPPDQTPVILSTGWNNPFAFTYDGDGVLWVADNSPGDQPERIGRGDLPAAEASDLDTASDGEAAPSALVSFPDGTLGRCGFLAGRVDVVEVDAGAGTARLRGVVAGRPCRTGAAVLIDGRLVTASDDALMIF